MKKILVTLIVASIFVSCGHKSNDSSNLTSGSSSSRSDENASFVMLKEVHQQMPTCAVGANLSLSDGKALMATVKNVVVGMCDLYVNPDERSYELTPRRGTDSCGTVIYEGKNAQGTILITDLRNWNCPTFPTFAAPLEYLVKMEETRNGETSTMFSQKWDMFPDPKPVMVN